MNTKRYKMFKNIFNEKKKKVINYWKCLYMKSINKILSLEKYYTDEIKDVEKIETLKVENNLNINFYILYTPGNKTKDEALLDFSNRIKKYFKDAGDYNKWLN